MQDTFTLDELQKKVADERSATAQAADPVEIPVEEESMGIEKLRHLEACDLFVMTSILSNIGLSQFSELLKDSDLAAKLQSTDGKPTDEDIKGLGASVMLEAAQIVCFNAWKCENYLNRLIAGMYDVALKDVPHLPPSDYLEMIFGIFTDENFLDFFKAAARLLHKMMG